jgi:hypothetical protein
MEETDNRVTLSELRRKNPYFDIEQGSDTWHGQRGVGSTGISVLLGISGGRNEWRNVWNKYTGRPYQDKDLSRVPAIVYGTQTEPVAAAFIGQKLLPAGTRMVFPGLLERTTFSRRWTDSPDFIVVNKEDVVIAAGEIKCPYSRAKLFEARTITYAYYVQCQWHMYISGTDKCFFVDYKSDREVMTHVILADEPLQETLVFAAHTRLLRDEYSEPPDEGRRLLRQEIRRSALKNMVHYIP